MRFEIVQPANKQPEDDVVKFTLVADTTGIPSLREWVVRDEDGAGFWETIAFVSESPDGELTLEICERIEGSKFGEDQNGFVETHF